jgi:hypothetical protein
MGIVYRLIWLLCRFTHLLYFRKVYHKFGHKNTSFAKGKLFAANHPNSFLDAISLAIQLPYPLAFLARGDALQGSAGKFLTKYLHLLPVWREREGRENLKGNYNTFDLCLDIWTKGGAVIIFTEGLCVNEWHLRPFPKGTARMAQSAWEKGIDLDIIPTAFNYGHFHGPGKSLFIQTARPIEYKELFDEAPTPAIGQRRFNELLALQLNTMVWEAKTQEEANTYFPEEQVESHFRRTLRKIVVAMHAPYYLPIKRFIQSKTTGTVHYDSALFGVLLLTYPLFLVAISALFWLGFGFSPYWILLWPGLTAVYTFT